MGKGKVGEKFLIEKIKKGDEHAFEIAFLKYFNSLCQYIWKFVRSEEGAKEIVQEVFMEVWENRNNLNPSGHLRGLLFEIARNKALDYIKHQKIASDYIFEQKRQKNESVHEVYNQHSQHEGLIEAAKQAISDLPPRGRTIYKLNRDEGLTYKEISEYLDISIKTVEAHMRRNLNILRKRLSQFVPFYCIIANSGLYLFL